MVTLNTVETRLITILQSSEHLCKEGVILRKVSPSLGLSDHFPGCGILNYMSDWDWSLRVVFFGGAV